jgi:hypothetical protein
VAKLYQRLLKLPLSKSVTTVVFALLNAHHTFMREDRASHLQLLVHLSQSSVDQLTAKLVKAQTPEIKANAIALLKFFLLGYTLQPKYFTDHADRFSQALAQCKESTDYASTQALIDLLAICMAAYSGHPEIYIEFQERIGELLYD